MNVTDVKSHLRGLETMRQLEPAYFAPLGGAADVVARSVGGKVKMAQLRKLFGGLKRVERQHSHCRDDEELEKDGVYLLYPDIAYANARNLISNDFFDVMAALIEPERLKTVGDFRRVMEFMQAVVAYHKYRFQGR